MAGALLGPESREAVSRTPGLTHNIHVAPFMPVIPSWLDQVSGIDFSQEKALLGNLEKWASGHGWTVTDGEELSHELRARTDVLIRKNGDRVRVGVMPKNRSDQGMVTLEASTLRTADLVFQAKKGKWRVEIGAAPVEDDVESAGYGRLFSLLFKP